MLASMVSVRASTMGGGACGSWYLPPAARCSSMRCMGPARQRWSSSSLGGKLVAQAMRKAMAALPSVASVTRAPESASGMRVLRQWASSGGSTVPGLVQRPRGAATYKAWSSLEGALGRSRVVELFMWDLGRGAWAPLPAGEGRQWSCARTSLACSCHCVEHDPVPCISARIWFVPCVPLRQPVQNARKRTYIGAPRQRSAWICQTMTRVLTKQFANTEPHAFRGPHPSNGTGGGGFRGHAVRLGRLRGDHRPTAYTKSAQGDDPHHNSLIVARYACPNTNVGVAEPELGAFIG